LENLSVSDKTLQVPPLEEIVETLLVEAGCGAPPTNENRLLDFLNLRQLSFDFMQDPELARVAVKQDIRAVLSLNHRVVATQPGLNPKRKRFGILHEIGHFINHEHLQKLFYDTDETLSWYTHVRIEREANETAAQLLFQGNRFTEEAISLPLSAHTPIKLAPTFDASYEASLRRYTERHVLPCALIVFDKKKTAKLPGDTEDDIPELRLQYTITSAPFRRKYFSGLEAGSSVLETDLLPDGSHWGTSNIVEGTLNVRGNERNWVFETEVFSNGYKIFQFLVRETKS